MSVDSHASDSQSSINQLGQERKISNEQLWTSFNLHLYWPWLEMKQRDKQLVEARFKLKNRKTRVRNEWNNGIIVCPSIISCCILSCK